MCGCEKHHDKRKSCTCICKEHGNFDMALKLALDRYDDLAKYRQWHEEARQEAADLRAENQRLMRERDRLAGIVERVEALAEEWLSRNPDRWHRWGSQRGIEASREAHAREVRAAIEGVGGES